MESRPEMDAGGEPSRPIAPAQEAAPAAAQGSAAAREDAAAAGVGGAVAQAGVPAAGVGGASGRGEVAAASGSAAAREDAAAAAGVGGAVSQAGVPAAGHGGPGHPTPGDAVAPGAGPGGAGLSVTPGGVTPGGVTPGGVTAGGVTAGGVTAGGVTPGGGTAVSAAGSDGASPGAVLPGAGSPPGGALIRASDRERDDVVRRLQEAFAEGRIGDDEFDERMRAALVARTRAALDRLLADLPAQEPSRQVATAADAPAEGRFAIAIKGSVRRGGRWRVPHRMTTVAYKGGSHLDLRAAELTAPVTAIRAVGYKSDVEIVVPPGVRVVAGGFGVSRGMPDDAQETELPQDAPVLHVRGFAYKGHIEIRARPRSR
jgi:uncharacterized protein DUF1707